MIPSFLLIHLRQVYLSLLFCLICSAIGAYLHLIWTIGGSLTALGIIGSIGVFCSVPLWKEGKRVYLLMVAAFFAGASIGPLIDLVLTVDQGFIVRAFVGTAMVFGWFSVATLLTQHRVFIYLVGSLFSSLSITILLTIASTIFGGYSIWDSNLPSLLGLCAGYIMWYSQVIIEQASRGNLDHVGRALAFFTVLPVGFVILVTLLAEETI